MLFIFSSSYGNGIKIDTSLFVQKLYLRTNYIEDNIEEDSDLKGQYRIKKLPDPISIREPAPKHCVDNLINDPSIIRNNAHMDLNDRNITNAIFIQVNQWPQIDSHLTPKLYVDNSIDEPSLVRNNQVIDFNNNNLTNTKSNTLNKQAEKVNEVINKAYVDQFHQENERSRRELGLDFYDESNDLVKDNQDNDFNDIKLINLDSITVNRNPTSDNELSTKKNVDDELYKNTIVRFSQTLRNYPKVSAGNDTYNLSRYDKIQLTDVTEIRYPNIRITLLPKWKLKNLYEINGAKLGDFLKTTSTNSPTSHSGATSLPPIGNSFMYIEAGSNNHGNIVFVSFERADTIQINNIAFYYNRFSILTNDSLKSMGRFRFQLLLEDNTWSTRYNIPKNVRYSDTSTDWTLVSLNFTVEIYGIKLINDQIDTAHADMCFSIITKTHSLH